MQKLDSSERAHGNIWYCLRASPQTYWAPETARERSLGQDLWAQTGYRTLESAKWVHNEDAVVDGNQGALGIVNCFHQ